MTNSILPLTSTKNSAFGKKFINCVFYNVRYRCCIQFEYHIKYSDQIAS